MFGDSLSDAVCYVLAAVLVVGGTTATGVLPSKPVYQAVAGGAIVAGFALPYLCLRETESEA